NTINAYFCVGLKCAAFLSPKLGKLIYYGYAVAALLLFSFMGTSQAQSAMAIAGVSLLILNSIGIFLLRHEISFDLKDDKKEQNVPVPEADLVRET
ncbi:MAG: hypothetical protein ACHQUC_05130, partial [Chlamydiales bacterium]